MQFKYLDDFKSHPLINHFYQLVIDKNDAPFNSLVVPIGHTNITYVYADILQEYHFSNKVIKLKDLILSGQIYGHYHVSILEEAEHLGLAFKPTALYRILETDISEFNNLHLPLHKVNKNLTIKLDAIFIEYRNNHQKIVEEIGILFNQLELSKDKNLPHIDKAIDIILEKDGLLSVNELLEFIPLSQKTLETQFKKIVGVTPGKYIKQHRFTTLMRKYQSNEVDINTLIYQFDYYDQSHFTRDFKFFTGQSPKEYFSNDYPLIEKYLR